MNYGPESRPSFSETGRAPTAYSYKPILGNDEPARPGRAMLAWYLIADLAVSISAWAWHRLGR